MIFDRIGNSRVVLRRPKGGEKLVKNFGPDMGRTWVFRDFGAGHGLGPAMGFLRPTHTLLLVLAQSPNPQTSQTLLMELALHEWSDSWKDGLLAQSPNPQTSQTLLTQD